MGSRSRHSRRIRGSLAAFALRLRTPDCIKPAWAMQKVVETFRPFTHRSRRAHTTARPIHRGRAHRTTAGRPGAVLGGQRSRAPLQSGSGLQDHCRGRYCLRCRICRQGQVHVAMVEGKVIAVLSQGELGSAAAPEGGLKSSNTLPIELSAGEALAVRADGAATVLPKADIEAATAWRQGKCSYLSRSNTS